MTSGHNHGGGSVLSQTKRIFISNFVELAVKFTPLPSHRREAVFVNRADANVGRAACAMCWTLEYEGGITWFVLFREKLHNYNSISSAVSNQLGHSKWCSIKWYRFINDSCLQNRHFLFTFFLQYGCDPYTRALGRRAWEWDGNDRHLIETICELLTTSWGSA